MTRDFFSGGSHAVRAAAHCRHFYLRPGADCRQSCKQHDDRLRRVDGIPETGDLRACVFLVVIHKLEYFLNSKIIGDRIRNPVWLTLIALIIGERLMGIPGLILAPVVLNYLRVEMLTVEVPTRRRRSRSLRIVERLNRRELIRCNASTFNV